ncbi:MAG: hypothetical protein NT029_00225 [Armatimonadetes bacterium]|nr:hypothetical protein [Armatimonadota bacterium]
MKWCPYCKLILTGVDDAPEAFVCAGCGGAWFDPPITPGAATAALAAVSVRSSAAPDASSYAGLEQTCPVCPGGLLVADAGSDLRCAKCGGVWLSLPRLLALSADNGAERPPADTVTAVAADSDIAQPPPTPQAEPLTVAAPGPPSVVIPPPPPPAFRYPDPPVDPGLRSDPELALAWLLEGNARYVAGAALAPRRTAQTRSHTSTGQKPVAVVVTCSDSRVPPELLFDVGIGDIFVVRSAGHVLDRAGLESISYAVEHLGVALVVVLGHTACGAVRAALAPGGPPPGLDSLMRAISRATDWAASEGAPDEQRTIRLHTLVTAALIRKHVPALAAVALAPTCAVSAAVYDLDSGAVDLVPHEEQPRPTPPQQPMGGTALQQDRRSRMGQADSKPGGSAAGPGRPAAVTQADGAATAGAERWCAQCMTPGTGNTQFCTTCGRALVEPWFRIACPNCHKENLIGTPRCWRCGADLHAAPAVPAPPEVHQERATKPNGASCAGVLVSIAAALTVIALSLHG